MDISSRHSPSHTGPHAAWSRAGFRSGFTLVEAVIACALLLVVSTAILGGIAFSYQARAASDQRGRAVLLAAEGLEAVRNMRDNAFSNLVNGTYGLATSSGKWILSGSSDASGGFTRTIAISTVDSDTKQVVSTVSWPGDALSAGTTSATTYLTNLALLYQQANSLSVNTSGALGGTTGLSGVTLQDSGSRAITVSKIAVSWTNTLRKISKIVIGAVTVWSSTGPGTPTGTQPSGTVLTIQAATLAPSAGASAITFTFNGSMVSTGYTFVFTMSDGTAKTVSI